LTHVYEPDKITACAEKYNPYPRCRFILAPSIEFGVHQKIKESDDKSVEPEKGSALFFVRLIIPDEKGGTP
jgi:hypothetical protein